MFKFLRSRLHYDVIVTSYVDGWYLFWYQWKEKTYSYTWVANNIYKVIGRSLEKFHVGVATTPPPLRRTCYIKCLRRTRVNDHKDTYFGHTVLLILKMSKPVKKCHIKQHTQENITTLKFYFNT